MKKRIRILVITSVSLVALLFAIHIVAFYLIERVIRQELEKLNSYSLEVSYKSVNTSWLSRSLEIEDLRIEAKRIIDETCDNPVAIQSEHIVINGISLLSAAINKKLNVDQVILRSPSVVLHEEFKLSQLTTLFEQNEGEGVDFIKHVHVNQITLHDVTVESIHPSRCDSIFRTNFTLNIYDGNLKDLHKQPIWDVDSVTISNAAFHLYKDFYTISTPAIRYDRIAGSLTIDSVDISPHYDKGTFAAKSRKEIDRIAGTIPRLSIRNFSIPDDQFAVYASHVSFSFVLDVLRDKRYPFRKKKETVLPVQFIHNLPFPIRIDTVQLYSSSVWYQEIAEEGTEAGSVVFENLIATIANITNDSTATEGATMFARTAFMNDGILEASFQFPPQPDGPYYARGALTNFQMVSLNQMLEPVARASVESGLMNELRFSFTYNDHEATGEVVMNYENLKIFTLQKDDRSRVNRLLSFIINTFIVRTNMDKGTPTDQRSGTIAFERIRKRSIFNYWWNSLFSGIKSTYNLDNILPDKKD